VKDQQHQSQQWEIFHWFSLYCGFFGKTGSGTSKGENFSPLMVPLKNISRPDSISVAHPATTSIKQRKLTMQTACSGHSSDSPGRASE